VRCRGGGVRPPAQNGWATTPSEDRHTLLPKVKGRREGVEDAVKEGASDGVPECVVSLANRFGEFVGVESPSTGIPCQEDWACKDGGGDQCDDEIRCVGVPSGVGR
jgi:hypothetical protein